MVIPSLRDLVHELLHAIEVPAFAVFAARQKIKQPGIKNNPAQHGHSVRVFIEPAVNHFVLHVDFLKMYVGAWWLFPPFSQIGVDDLKY